jgi:hypothetical protein
MKLLMSLIVSLGLLGAVVTPAFAEAEIKEVCHDKVGKDGKPVMKDGKAVQECKKIKVHKKLEGTEIPPAKK